MMVGYVRKSFPVCLVTYAASNQRVAQRQASNQGVRTYFCDENPIELGLGLYYLSDNLVFMRTLFDGLHFLPQQPTSQS